MKLDFTYQMVQSKKFLIVVSILFGVANTQRPLFSENQNTKFLHGMAEAGYGYLAHDWQANTWNPLPVFTYLIAYSQRFFSQYSFYIYYIILNAIFFLSLFWLVVNMFDIRKGSIKYLIILLILFVIHSELFDVVGYRITANQISLRDFLTQGLAWQYLNNSYFQPSLFGILFITSILSFRKGKIYLAAFLAALVALFHSASIFIAAMIVISYMLILFFKKRKLKEAFLVGFLAFIVVSPILIQNLQEMMKQRDAIADEALGILVHEVIPFHTLISFWFTNDDLIKIGVMLLGTLLVFKKEEGFIMTTLFMGGLIFSLVQLFTKSDQLALIAPWRVSVVLVPLAVMVIVGYLVSNMPEKWESSVSIKRISVTAMLAVIVVTTVMGGYLHYERLKDYNNLPYALLMQYVKHHKSENDTYLIPSEMAEFRLVTGAPVFITYKSHPYESTEFMTWYHKVKQVDELMSEKNIDCENLDNIARNNDITHVVLPTEKFFDCEATHCIYEDSKYCVYELKKYVKYVSD